MCVFSLCGARYSSSSSSSILVTTSRPSSSVGLLSGNQYSASEQSPYQSLVKPRLHQIHVAGYKYPGRATCIRIQVDTCRRDDNFIADTGYM